MHFTKVRGLFNGPPSSIMSAIARNICIHCFKVIIKGNVCNCIYLHLRYSWENDGNWAECNPLKFMVLKMSCISFTLQWYYWVEKKDSLFSINEDESCKKIIPPVQMTTRCLQPKTIKTLPPEEAFLTPRCFCPPISQGIK